MKLSIEIEFLISVVSAIKVSKCVNLKFTLFKCYEGLAKPDSKWTKVSYNCFSDR